MSEFPPSIVAGTLTERVSAKGNTYLSGYFGTFRVTIFKTSDVDDKGNPVWTLRFGEAPKRDKASGEKPSGTVARAQAMGTPADSFSKPRSNGSSSRSSGLDDEIPF